MSAPSTAWTWRWRPARSSACSPPTARPRRRRARDGGQAVLFSSHVLTEVEQVCDRVGILQRGRLVHLQTMAELRERRLVRVEFAGVVEGLPDLPGLGNPVRDGARLTFPYD